MVILKEGRALFLSANLKPGIGILDPEASIGCKDRLWRRLADVAAHLRPLVIFIQLLHFLPSFCSNPAERFLCFLDDPAHVSCGTKRAVAAPGRSIL